MKSLVALTIASILSTQAFAGGHYEPPKPQTGVKVDATSSSISDASANSASHSDSNSSATGGNGGDGGSSVSDSTSSSGGNALSVASYGVRSAPDVIPPPVYPTASCQGGFSIGGSGINGGGALGFGFTKKECATIVLSQNLLALGMTEEACQALMSTPSAKRVWGDKLPKCERKPVLILHEPAPTPGVTPKDLTETEIRINERIDRAFRRSTQK